MTRQAIVAANWKMNGDSALVDTMVLGLADVKLSSHVDVVICPSFPYLSELNQKIKAAKLNEAIHVGSQNVSEHESGAFTGEISTTMLKNLAINYVIVGHSERRSIFKETSTQVAKKVHAALNAGLTPILCIGESEAERATEQTETVLASQLQPVIDEVGIEKFIDVVIAYEPVWAIGTGKTATPEQANSMHKTIRKELESLASPEAAENMQILYGGSVNAENAKTLLSQSEIDGALVGGASLKTDAFPQIVAANS